MQQAGAKHEMGGTDFKWGGASLLPPLETTLRQRCTASAPMNQNTFHSERSTLSSVDRFLNAIVSTRRTNDRSSQNRGRYD